MPDQQQTTSQDRFWKHLYALYEKDDRAALAKLRRAVADPIDGNVFSVIGGSLPPDASDREIDAHLFVACLFALHPTRASGDSLGGSLNRLRGRMSVGVESLDGRFAAILNSDGEDLPGRLRHIIRLLASYEVPVDYPRLLRDILGWDRDDRRVQRRWALDYWRAGRDEDAEDAPVLEKAVPDEE